MLLYGYHVLIESDWNLKPKQYQRRSADHVGINRIRLEFKEECKEILSDIVLVLIESDWNLKLTTFDTVVLIPFVLIESDWNLKYIYLFPDRHC